MSLRKRASIHKAKQTLRVRLFVISFLAQFESLCRQLLVQADNFLLRSFKTRLHRLSSFVRVSLCFLQLLLQRPQRMLRPCQRRRDAVLRFAASFDLDFDHLVPQFHVTEPMSRLALRLTYDTTHDMHWTTGRQAARLI